MAAPAAGAVTPLALVGPTAEPDRDAGLFKRPNVVLKSVVGCALPTGAGGEG